MTPRTPCSRASAALSSALLLVACGGGGDGPRYQTNDAGITTPDAEDAVESACSGQEDGSACGTDLHCEAEQCLPDRCGDGLVNGRETCDDGNELNGDGCDAECLPEGGCGNAKLEDGEECDDGNWVDFDACSNRCKIQRCGNGRLDHDEECDDGNAVDTDGCSNGCVVRACRNGRVEPGEECDDGNQVDQGDGCTNSCQTSICGNGKIEKYEDCDDGNRVNDDACANNCVRAICGDGVIQPGEACEKGQHRMQKLGSGPNLKGEHQACTADCKGWTAQDPCVQCQERNCTLEGVDIAAGCLRQIDPQFGADPDDTAFLDLCISAVQCSIEKRCFDETDARNSGMGCYCGSASLDECGATGPVQGPCRMEWEFAAKAETVSQVLGNISDLQYPATWMFFLLRCYQQSRTTTCAAECADQLRAEPNANTK